MICLKMSTVGCTPILHSVATIHFHLAMALAMAVTPIVIILKYCEDHHPSFVDDISKIISLLVCSWAGKVCA